MPSNVAMIMLALSTSTDVGKLEFSAAVGVLFGVFLFVRGFQMLRYKRLILNTPSSKVRSASMGLVEITGTAKGPQTIPAGITGEPCYYYRATAWKLTQDGKNRNWKQVADESLYVPFFVDDSTGRMLVNAQGAQLDVHCNFKDEIGTSFFGSNDMVPPNVSRFLLRYGLVGEQGIRLEEYCVKPEYPLFVLGTLGRNVSGQIPQWSPASQVPRSQSSHATNLSFLGPSGNAALRGLGWTTGVTVQVSRAATPTSGTLNPLTQPVAATTTKKPAPPSTAWSSVSMDEATLAASRAAIAAHASTLRTAPLGSVSRTVATAVAVADPAPAEPDPPPTVDDAGFEIHPAVAIGKGTDGAPFTISSRSQREVVEYLAWKSTLCIWGGPAITLICLYFLCFAFGWT
jgi:hypothetical protein